MVTRWTTKSAEQEESDRPAQRFDKEKGASGSRSLTPILVNKGYGDVIHNTGTGSYTAQCQ